MIIMFWNVLSVWLFSLESDVTECVHKLATKTVTSQMKRADPSGILDRSYSTLNSRWTVLRSTQGYVLTVWDSLLIVEVCP